jgi:hypothetical protein
MARAKHWCFTLFEETCSFIDNDDVDYCIYGREICPDTGKNHLQGYLALNKRMRLAQMKKLHATCHWEVKKGTVKEARQYCMKDGDYVEHGEIPDESGTNNSYRHCVELAKEGKMDNISDEYPGLYTRYKRTYEGMRKFVIETLDEPRGYWIYGKPGTSKDSNVMDLKPFVKPHNKWWDGYDGEQYILFSDVDHNTAKWCGTFLKTWMDRYPFTAEMKGSSIQISPKRFYVTSNYQIAELFDSKMQEAIERRCHQINFDEDIIFRRPKICKVSKRELIDF